MHTKTSQVCTLHHQTHGNAGPPNAAHTDGTPVSQAQVACHAAEGSQPVLAMAMGQTLYLAALDESEQGSSQPSAPQWDCTDLAALPLSSMTSLQLPHTVRYLAFSLSGHNLAAVNSADQVCCVPVCSCCKPFQGVHSVLSVFRSTAVLVCKPLQQCDRLSALCNSDALSRAHSTHLDSQPLEVILQAVATVVVSDGLRCHSMLLQVVVWSLPGPGQISKDTTLQTLVQFQPDPQSTCNTVHWLSPATLVVGCANNSIISLWHISDTAECLQTVKLVSNMQSGSSDAYLHMVVQPEAGIVILADAKSPVVYALHINSTADNAKFDYLAEFVVGQPILSLAADYTPSEDPNVLQLFCVQEKAIQLYTLNLAQCEPALLPTVPSSVLSEAASALQMPHRDSQPSTPAASNRQADPLSSSHQQPSTLATPGGQAEALSASDQQQSLQEAAGSLPALPLPISTPPASSLPDQPKLLTPKHLMQHTTRSASQTSMSSMTGQVTPKTESAPLNQVLDALAPRAASLHRPAGSNLPGLRGQIDNSDAVSSTSMQGSLLTPGDLSRPASALSGSTVPRSAATLDAELKQEQKQKSPGASPAGSRSSTPPPTTPAMPSAAYLTPEQYNGEPASPTPPADAAAAAATEAASPTGSAAEDSSRQLFAEGPPDGAASPDQVPGSNKVLQKRQEATESSQRLGNGNDPSSAFDQPLDMLPVASAAPVSPPPGLPQTQVVSDDGSVSQQQQSQQQAQPQHRQEQLQSQQQVQHQQPSALSLQSPAAVLSQQVELSDLSARRIVDAVAERTLAQHKRMLSHLHDGHREMLRIIKADISKEGKRLQAAIEAQVIHTSRCIALGQLLAACWLCEAYLLAASAVAAKAAGSHQSYVMSRLMSTIN